jgi:hypothetical protein
MVGLAAALKSHIPSSVDLMGFSEKVQGSEAVVQTLIQLANVEKLDLTQVILEVNQDVMGMFTFSSIEGKTGYLRSYGTGICLYWGVIGLVARLLGLSVEGLTIKVLAHEYAHAYTHLGFDRSGKRWSGFDYSRSQH